jgi:hypothetical protein
MEGLGRRRAGGHAWWLWRMLWWQGEATACECRPGFKLELVHGACSGRGGRGWWGLQVRLLQVQVASAVCSCACTWPVRTPAQERKVQRKGEGGCMSPRLGVGPGGRASGSGPKGTAGTVAALGEAGGRINDERKGMPDECGLTWCSTDEESQALLALEMHCNPEFESRRRSAFIVLTIMRGPCSPLYEAAHRGPYCPTP